MWNNYPAHHLKGHQGLGLQSPGGDARQGGLDFPRMGGKAACEAWGYGAEVIC